MTNVSIKAEWFYKKQVAPLITVYLPQMHLSIHNHEKSLTQQCIQILEILHNSSVLCTLGYEAGIKTI